MRNEPVIQRLDVLTSMRFLAALHVVLYHLWSNGYVGLIPTSGERHGLADLISSVLHGILSTGYASVSLFFVLSGFILSYNYVGRPPTSPSMRRKFWISRFARIYPVYVLGLIMWLPAAIFLMATGEKSLLKTVISLPLNLLLIQSWSGATALSWNAPGWSLSAEALFYFLFPFILPLLLNRKLPVLILFIAGSYCLSLLAPAMYSILRPDGLDPAKWPHAYYADAPILLTIKFLPILRLPEFVLGVVVGLIHQRLPHRSSARFDFMAVVLLVLIVAVMVQVQGVGFIFLHNGLLAPLFGFLILSLARSSVLVRAGEAKMPVLLGESSYSLYIVHGPVLIWMTKMLRPTGSPTDIVLAAVYVLAVVLLSVAVFKWVEKPLRTKIISMGKSGASLAPVSPLVA